jgi:hypothetical protein
MENLVTLIKKELSFGVNRLILVVFLCNFIAFISCNKPSSPDVVKTTGSLISIQRNLTNFTELDLYDNVHIDLFKDTSNFAVIKAGKNLIPKILTSIKDSILTIENSNTFNFLRNYKDSIIIQLHTTSLNHIKYYGSGYIKSKNTIAQKLFALESWYGSGRIQLDLNTEVSSFGFHTGFCDLKVTGKSIENRLYGTEQGKIDCKDLITEKTFCHNRGIANWFVNATSELGVELYGDGNVYFTGTPKVVYSKFTAKGKLIKQ